MDLINGENNAERLILSRLARGDEEALRSIMDKYDRLLRYTIFRTAKAHCVRDPQWLDAVASETWTGFLRSARRGTPIAPGALAGYLVGVARRQAISALRRAEAFAQPATSSPDTLDRPDAQPDPAGVAADLESLSALRDCAAHLPDEDQLLMTQLLAITQRRWLEAATALAMSESTLRSKWTRVLVRLRACMEKKHK